MAGKIVKCRWCGKEHDCPRVSEKMAAMVKTRWAKGKKKPRKPRRKPARPSQGES